MKIILTQNVPNLGSLGDEVSVKDGYARNFLLPRGMAMAASGANARAIQHRRVFLDKQRQEAISAARGEADKVTALQVVVKAKAGTGGRLFGSITNRDLQAALAEQGLELDRKAIILHAPVKTLGTFTASVRLHTDVRVELEFRVEASEIVAMPKAEGEGEAPAEGEAAPAEAGAEAPAAEAAAAPAAEEAPTKA
jgi:large subunit ribosomal protein L9